MSNLETNDNAKLECSDENQSGTSLNHPAFKSLRKSLDYAIVQPLLKGDDPIIAFDQHVSDADSDAPIEFGIRQPSFTSLSDHQLIPKGSNSMADFTPILEEVEPHPEPVIEERDSDPNVLLVQEMKVTNSERWSKMGYVPPDNLIHLVRAASQSIFQPEQIVSLDLQKNHSFVSNLLSEPIKEDSSIPNDIAEKEENQKLDSPATSHLRRSSSFGNLPGQSQVDKNSLIIVPSEQYCQSNFNKDITEPEKTEKSKAFHLSLNCDQFAGKLVPSTSKDEDLFGHLCDIIKEPKNSLQYSILQTGEIPEEAVDEFDNLIQIFEKYRKICQENKWTEETEYLTDIITILMSSICYEEEDINEEETQAEE